MANIRIMCSSTGAHTNRWASATLTASSSATALPAADSQSTDRSLPWRSATQTADVTLDADLGSAVSLTCVGVANVRLQNSGTLELYSGGTGGSPSWPGTLLGTFPAQDVDTRATYLFINSVSVRHLRLKFVNGNGAVADYAEAGYVFAGIYLEPNKGVVKPVEMSMVDPSIANLSVDGQATFSNRTKYSQGKFVFQTMSQSEIEQLRALYRSVGVATPIFVVLDTTVTWQAWLLRISEPLVNTREVATFYRAELPWVEAR